MRVKSNEFQNKLKQSLNEPCNLSAELEERLFAQADRLLAAKRERLASRRAGAIRVAEKKARFWSAFQECFSSFLDVITIRPDIPAAATALAALVLAFFALHGGHERGMSLRHAEFPDFPKNNDAPARYDAQRVAEQIAYEREVEDAHQKTSGGI